MTRHDTSRGSGILAASKGDFDLARRRMLAHAALIEHLGAPAEPPQLAAQVLAQLCDDVLAIAIYVQMPDASLTLVSHGGFACAPPAHAASAAAIYSPQLAELAELAGARRLLSLDAARPAWVGDRSAALAAVPFGSTQRVGKQGLVLFALRTNVHDPSQAALLDLGAQCIARALDHEAGSSSEQPSHARARIRVLLIDDEDLLVDHVRRILERAGFEFHAAHRAREGFAIATSIRPDVILMDKVMPDLDGTELLRLMRGNELLSTTPVIMLSGQADESARVAALRAGADDFVIKPFSAKELVARIQANIRLVRLRRDVVWRQGELVRLRQSQQELRTLLDTVQKVRDDERRMLARELHDRLGQILTAVKIDVRLLQDQLVDPGRPQSRAEISGELEGALSSVDLAIASVQDISALLRPPALEEGGLVAALHWLAVDMRRRGRIECAVLHDPAGYVEPPPFVAAELLRICQEALTNVLRHARATGVVLQIVIRGDYLVVRICDNGLGISWEQRHDPAALGLQGMRERAASIRASIHIHGKRGRGTLVVIRRRVAFR
ncbi:MAG: response regulator [Telluria sp.]